MKNIYSFDGTEIVNNKLSDANVQSINSNIDRKFVIRGNGLSYCGASMNQDSIYSTSNLNRIINFDINSKQITVESGITIGKILSFTKQYDLWLPCVPGHPNITIGGCIAFNVHGKNQYSKGNFNKYIISFKLFHPYYGEMNCSETENSDIFNLTIGGAGLTGFITEATLKLQDLENKVVSRKFIHIPSFFDAQELLIRNAENSFQLFTINDLSYKVKWGNGILIKDVLTKTDNISIKNNIQKSNLRADNRRDTFWGNLNYDFFFKLGMSYMINRYRLFSSRKVLSQYSSLFPLSEVDIYYKIYGKRGFREYQCIIPHENWFDFITELQLIIKKHKVFIRQCSLKLFVGEQNYLRFCGEGIAIAFDVDNTPKNIQFLNDIDALCIETNAIFNISKDSRLTANVLSKSIMQYELFKNKLQIFDPNKCLNSILRIRLDV